MSREQPRGATLTTVAIFPDGYLLENLAVRADANPPAVMDMDVKTTQGHAVRYKLVSVPLYLLWNLPDILAA